MLHKIRCRRIDADMGSTPQGFALWLLASHVPPAGKSAGSGHCPAAASEPAHLPGAQAVIVQ